MGICLHIWICDGIRIIILMIASSSILMSHWSPFCTFGVVWRYKSLIYQLTKRDFVQRYKGSYLGFAWALMTPLLFLLIYMFVFNVVMKARWGVSPDEGPMEFALGLFCGLILWGIFSEAVTSAPGLILSNSSYVTKTVFPLEILPIITVGSGLIRAVIGFVVLFVGLALFSGCLSWKIFILTLPIMGMIFFAMGTVWFLSAIGVFMRDVSHIVSVAVTLLFFLTPIVYPVSRVPPGFRIAVYANPFTHLVSAARAVTIWGKTPDWPWLMLSMAISVLVFQTGYVFFMKSKSAFADVM
jgi:lipopolysaccharide transport system permease protein